VGEAPRYLLNYAAAVRSTTQRHGAALRTYGERAAELIDADSRVRRHAIAARAAAAHSLAGVAGVTFGPREHALALGWILDPARSGQPVLHDLMRALHLDGSGDPVRVSPTEANVDSRVFDVLIEADDWRVAIAFGQHPRLAPGQLRSLPGHPDANTTLVWLTQTGGNPGEGWRALTWRTLDSLLSRYDKVPTIGEYRRVLREQVLQRLIPGEAQRQLQDAEHSELCSLQKRL
jgi:hypothetical protein